MEGDSHTNFDQQVFTVGAIGGSATIAAALVSGMRNAAALRRNRETLNAIHARDALIASLQRRINSQCTEVARRDETIRTQAMAIKELELWLQMAQFLREKGR